MELLSKNWKDREEAIAAKEKTIAQMETRFAGIDAEIKAAVDKQIAIIGNSMKRDFEHQTSLARMQSESDKRISDAAIAQMQENLAAKDRQIETFSSQLEAANKRVETISKEAVAASAGREALAAVQKQTEAAGQQQGARR
jgi:hypothetical protein